jgi:hypothetical protein
MRLASPIFASLAISSAAAAEPLSAPAAAPEADAPYAIGVRVGGYGFHRADDPGLIEGAGGSAWNECRMNGFGLFGERRLRGPFYLEAGLDAYFSIGPGAPTDLPIDRQNVLVTVAAGARTRFTSWLRGFVQIGGGVELAHVSVPYADGSTIRADKAMPDAFIGVGLDIRVARGTFIGAMLRTHVMDNFDYDPNRLKMANAWIAAPSPADVFATSPDLVAQGQFYLRRDL